jgi:hypothetical protein
MATCVMLGITNELSSVSARFHTCLPYRLEVISKLRTRMGLLLHLPIHNSSISSLGTSPVDGFQDQWEREGRLRNYYHGLFLSF